VKLIANFVAEQTVPGWQSAGLCRSQLAPAACAEVVFVLSVLACRAWEFRLALIDSVLPAARRGVCACLCVSRCVSVCLWVCVYPFVLVCVFVCVCGVCECVCVCVCERVFVCLCVCVNSCGGGD
jgi:hypothetical protein